MRIRLIGLIIGLTAAVTTGCGLIGTEPTEPSAQSGRVTVGDSTRHTHFVSCTQVQWDMTIEAHAGPARIRAFLQLGGEKPIVKTVTIENFDGLHGAVGGDLGNADAATDGNIYTITGTAVGSDWANPGQTKSMPFKIEAPC